ncbi:hypothetical protein MELA_00706 [Candidatus Methylomirabilis lanthanidiphila]|uniref:DUF177 domain-containing protein n=1 Tax=Candidatus Methylomirabilis lanthanidiphila TaxID=2211376 RepID=A0A564ZGA8_9BACT|nr:DUF177 domain-containing protein [Candidatus Methylomirabilis lanthanidiphila]VUZ84335.1 hypothetical protein MELA_00706 [Candidatus Methylomirabilis lanthanidiphila]
MLVERSQIPPEGLDLEVREEPCWEGVEGLWLSLAPVEASLHLERDVTGILASGTFSTTAIIQCSRCSEPVSVPISDSFTILYAEAGEAFDDEEVELSAAEMDVDVMQDQRLDVTKLLRENVLLNVPLQPLCRVDCRGLCPHCGINLNENTCECRVQEGDPRLLPLQQLL